MSAISSKFLKVWLYCGNSFIALVLPISEHKYLYNNFVKLSLTFLTSCGFSSPDIDVLKRAIMESKEVVMWSILRSNMLFKRLLYFFSYSQVEAQGEGNIWKSSRRLPPPPDDVTESELLLPALPLVNLPKMLDADWLLDLLEDEYERAIWSNDLLFHPMACDSWSLKFTPGLRIRAVRILTIMSTFFKSKLNWSRTDNLKKKRIVIIRCDVLCVSYVTKEIFLKWLIEFQASVNFSNPIFFPVVNKRWFICSIILAGEPVSKAKLLCDCRLHNTDLEKKKPVWNGFQTISARWHVISHWYEISDYVHVSIFDFYHVAELYY